MHTETLNYSVLPRSYRLKMTAEGWLDTPPDHTTGRCCPIYRLEQLERLNRAISTLGAKTQNNTVSISSVLMPVRRIMVFRCHQLVIQSQEQNKTKHVVSVTASPYICFMFPLHFLHFIEIKMRHWQE